MNGIIRSMILILLVAGIALSPSAYGQGGATGAISGTVVDVNGGSVAGADVQIINTATGLLVRQMTTTADGSFLVTLLPPATYYVVVNKSGFSEAKASGIAVLVTETTRLTVALKPGTVSEKIEITAQLASVETTNATTGQTIGDQTVRELPLATQNYQQLLALSTGAQSELNASASLGRGTTKIFVNGQREDNNNYLIEGISATDYNVAQSYYVPLPNPDVIQEFRVQTSLYDASQGRNGGGNINAILRTGTQQLHGDVYEFFRNDVLNANEYFHNATGQPRPPVKQNIFGASVGGPVIKEKLGFFFFNYQGTRQGVRCLQERRSTILASRFCRTDSPCAASFSPASSAPRQWRLPRKSEWLPGGPDPHRSRRAEASEFSEHAIRKHSRRIPDSFARRHAGSERESQYLPGGVELRAVRDQQNRNIHRRSVHHELG